LEAFSKKIIEEMVEGRHTQGSAAKFCCAAQSPEAGETKLWLQKRHYTFKYNYLRYALSA
jgi:hypothetical protein